MAERPARILLADDEQSILTLLSYPLRKDGYDVVRASDGREALDRFAESDFDLVVLDVMMPHVDGLEVCRKLRATSSVPIIMLTAKGEEFDKVLGLELGADDYITKPFSMREFRSRVKAALRRASMREAAAATAAEEGPSRWSPGSSRSTSRSGRCACEASSCGRLSSSSRSSRRSHATPGVCIAASSCWSRSGATTPTRPRTIDVHIRHLREKIERDAKEPEYLYTVRGVGYRFRDD